MTQVFHDMEFNPVETRTRVFPDNFMLVAEVDSDDIDDAFRLTNHIDDDWWNNPGVKKCCEEKVRSTSTGDVVVTSDGSVFACCTLGWAKVGNSADKPLPTNHSRLQQDFFMTDKPDNPNDETPEQDKKPKAERKMPNWMPLFYKTIHKHWQHHAPCEHINLMSEWNDETKCWHVNAAPVWQEILGGEDDGKRVWAGFLFDFGDFSRAEGVWVQEQAFMSVCSECTPYPKTMTKGKFRGHNFYLHLFLEPPQETEAVEVIDTIKKEIRDKMAPVSDPGEQNDRKA